MKLTAWLNADEVVTDERGWSVNLDIFRVIFLALAVLPWAFRNLHWIDDVMPDIPRGVWAPISFYQWLPFSVLTNANLAKALALLNIICIVLGLVGFGTRKALACAAFLSLYLFGLTENQGKIDHMHHLIWFVALMAAGPSGRFLSIDSLRRATQNADFGRVDRSWRTFDALWTLRFVWLLMGLLYLIPGLAKLDKAMVAGWASAANLQQIFWRKWLETALFDPASNMLLRIDLLPPWLIHLAGWGVIAFEVGFLFVVLFRPFRAPAAIAGFLFHVGNGLALQIWFTTLIPAYAALIDWCALGRKLYRVEKRPLVVLYDAKCRFCRRTIALLKTLDLLNAINPRPNDSSPSPFQADDLNSTSQQERIRDIQVIQGSKISTGYDAYVAIAWRIPLLLPAAVVMRWPFVAAKGRKIYRRIADSRHCSIAPPPVTLPADRPLNRPVLVVGSVLVVFQLFIGFAMFMYTEFPDRPATLPRPAKRLISAVGRRHLVWPFSYYPTFDASTPGGADMWQARWVVDGSEVPVSPHAYGLAFNNSGLVWSIVTDPKVQDQQRSLELVRRLWKSESPAVRQSASGVRVYWVSYRLGPPDHAPGTIVSDRLLFTFPTEAFTQQAMPHS